MNLTYRFHITSFFAGLALVGALGLIWLPAPTVEAGGSGFPPCTEDNVGEVIYASLPPCPHDVPAWQPWTCTEENGHYFWDKGERQCGDVISPTFP